MSTDSTCKTCGGSGSLNYDDGVTMSRNFECSHCAGTGTSSGKSRLSRIAGHGPAAEHVGQAPLHDEQFAASD